MGYLTTGEAADICGVQTNTIKSWIRKGDLKGVMLPGGHWRIPKQPFVHFLQTWNIPVPEPLLRGEAPARILAVDDDPQIHEFIRGAMEVVQYPTEVYTESDGYSGLIQIGRLQPQLLVLDIMMPEINGLELIHRLKAQPELAGNMRILAFTGAKDRRLVVRKLKEARPDEILFKPVDAQYFIEIVSRLLGKERTDTEGNTTSNAKHA